MKKHQLAKAIGMILTGGALTIAGTSVASASAAYYNTDKPIETTLSDPDRYTDASGLGTDGWTTTTQQAKNGADNLWLGTSSGALPFGYTGKAVANWAASITSAGDSLEISQDNAVSLYGTSWGSAPSSLVNIDTAKGAWYDGAQGWGHNTDIGLFKSDVNALVTLNLSAVFNSSEPDHWSNFGVTVFTGMATGNGYTHHYDWNNPGAGHPFTNSNPGGTTGVIYDGSIGVSTPGQAYDDTVDSTNGLTFLAQAGQVYSIYLGGNSGAGNFDPHAGYVLNISTAAVSSVPVPGAVWLFGSAMAGIIGYGRRRQARG